MHPDRPVAYVPDIPTAELTLRAAFAQLLEFVTDGQWRRKTAQSAAGVRITGRIRELDATTLGAALGQLHHRRVGSPSPRAWQVATVLVDRYGLARTYRPEAGRWDPGVTGDEERFDRLMDAAAWWSVRPDEDEFAPMWGEDSDEAASVRALPAGSRLALRSDLNSIDRAGLLWAHEGWLAGWAEHHAAAQRADVTPGAKLVVGDPRDTLWTAVSLGRLGPERNPAWVALRLVDIIV